MSEPRHRQPTEKVATVLSDFGQHLRILAADIPPVIVGGQAVNFWADYFREEEPELNVFQPFTSKDLDILGDVRDVDRIAQITKAIPVWPRKSSASPVIAMIPVTTAASETTYIEVLRTLSTPSAAEANAQAVELNSRLLETNVRVLNPIACLIDKTDNLVRLNQNQRQDLRHVQMLLFCTRAFLTELLAGMPYRPHPPAAVRKSLRTAILFRNPSPYFKAPAKIPD